MRSKYIIIALNCTCNTVLYDDENGRSDPVRPKITEKRKRIARK